MEKKQVKKKASVSVIAAWYVFSNFLIQGLAFLTAPIFSRMLSKVEYGQFSNFATWESILTVIVSVQLSATIPRAKQDYPGEEESYITSMAFVGNFIVLILFFLAELVPNGIKSLMDMEPKYVKILLLSLFFSPSFTLWQTKLRLEMKYKSVVFFSLFSALCSTILSVILVGFMDNKFEARVYGYIIPKTIINIGIWIYIWLKVPRISKKYIWYAIPIAIPLMLNIFVGKILSSSDRIMITNIRGEEETAMYTMGYSCASIASILWVSLNQAWSPWLYDKLKLKEYEEIRNKSKIYILIFGGILATAVLFVPEVILILGGKSYFESCYIVPPVMGGLFFQLIYGLYVNVETYIKKTYAIFSGTALAAIINILLNLFLIPQFGYIVASYTTLFGYFIMTVFHYFNVYRLKEYRGLYDTKFIFNAMLLAVVYQLFCTWLYCYSMLRYCIIAVLVVFGCLGVLLKRKQLMQIICDFR